MQLAVAIEQDTIELYKVLKIANVVGGGGEAKMLIAEGQVRVNGAIETRKRAKLQYGDVIELDGVQVILEALSEQSAKPETSSSAPQGRKPRRAISF